MTKLMADYTNNFGKLSSSLFDSLMLTHEQNNLTRLMELLELDNTSKKQLSVYRERMR